MLTTSVELSKNNSNMLLLFSHTLTLEQKKDARENLEVGEFISLPEDLQQKWSNIPPELESLKEYLQDIFEWIGKASEVGDYVLVEGDFGATYLVVNYCLKQGLIPVYATTQRRVVEEVAGDGVKTHRAFKYVRFRKYSYVD